VPKKLNGQTCANASECKSGFCVVGTCVADEPLNHKTVVAGSLQTCVVKADGTMKCWGSDQNGVLGNGEDGSQLTPGPVSGISDAVQVTAKAFHTCALRSGGSVSCWGKNDSGELGDGTTESSQVPVAVAGIDDALQVAVGQDFTCVLRDGGSVVCWGAATYGRLGNGSDTGIQLTPAAVSGVNDAIQVECGAYFACALRATGSVACWGYNQYGTLGDNSTTTRITPVAVSNLSDAKQIAVGVFNTCALRQSGAVACWGNGNYGRLGNGTTSGSSLVPTAVTGLTDALQVTMGHNHGCALRANGSVVCWGYSYAGVLGNGTEEETASTPTAVSNLTDATQISAKSNHTCAWTENGDLVCWGQNNVGQVGNGTRTNALTPTTVVGL
jgi:alpha-tubulin suppressor-like RCC1 family protein